MKSGLGAVVGLLAVGCASAAWSEPMPTMQWSGLYVGIHAGLDWNRASHSPFNDLVEQGSGAFIPGRGIVIVPGTTVPFPNSAFSSTSGFVGGQLGYSWNFDHLVVGAEGDLRMGSRPSTLSATNQLPLTALQAASTVTSTRTIETNWSWSARLRAGYAWDRWLLYATGGIAGSSVSSSTMGTFVDPGGAAAPCGPPLAPGCSPVNITAINLPVTNLTASTGHSNPIGWTVGGGGEFALSDDLSLGLEFRHTDFGRVAVGGTSTDVSVSNISFTFPIGATPTVNPPRLVAGALDAQLTDDAVTLRLNIRL